MSMTRNEQVSTEDAAAAEFMLATERLMTFGLAMASRLRPDEFSAAMEAIRAGQIRPVLAVHFNDPVHVVLQGVGADGAELARIFSYDLKLNHPVLN